MEEVLDKLRKAEGVLGVLLIDPDTHIVYSSSDLNISPPVLKGLFTSFGGYLNELIKAIEMGKLNEMIVEASQGRVIINAINGFSLTVFTTKQGNLGLIKFAISKAIKDLEPILKE